MNCSKDSETKFLCLINAGGNKKLDMGMFITGKTLLHINRSSEPFLPRIQTWKASSEQNFSKMIVKWSSFKN